MDGEVGGSKLGGGCVRVGVEVRVNVRRGTVC